MKSIKHIFVPIAFIVSLILGTFVLSTNHANAASIVSDDFNTYANGGIVGQGSWSSYANGGNFVVQNTNVFEGTKGLYNSASADSIITKLGTPLSDGGQSVYIRTQNRSSWGTYANGNAQVRISRGSWGGSELRNFIAASFRSDGNVAYYDPSSDTYTNFSTYNDNEWTLLEFEWRSIDKKARYRVNNGTWTDWKSIAGSASFTDFDTVGFDSIYLGGSGGVYIDSLSSTPACSEDVWSCDEWNSCSANGTQTRTCTKTSNCTSVETSSPATSQACVYTPPTCTSWTYSDWSFCSVDKQQTRTVASASPSGCAGGSPVLSQSCVRGPIITSITPAVLHYYDEAEIIGTGFGNDRTRGGVEWAGTGAASYTLAVDSWTDTKIRIRINQEFPGNPYGSHGITIWINNANGGNDQSNSFVVNIEKSSCDPKNWSCGAWSACTAAGQQTRSCNKALICEGAVTSPPITQNCTYVPSCNTDTWLCGDWNQCSSNGTQSRSCTKSFDCPTASTPSPTTSQNCTPPQPQKPQQPSCTEDVWSCGGWGNCSQNGFQSRGCKRTFDCPSVEDPSPSTSQSCDAPITTPSQPQPQQPQNQTENIDRDQIFRATVKLFCPILNSKYGKQGSGTIIDQYGSVLTNRHVVEGTIGTCHAGFINGEDDIPSYNEIADVKKISYDAWPNGDIALLKIRNPNGKLFSAIDIQKGNSDALRTGVDTILPFGYPNEDLFGETITATDGAFLGRGTTLKVCGASFNVSKFFKTAALIDHGNSGGGAYQKKTGYFVGIPTLGTSCKPEIPSRVNYILSVNTIKKWLNSLGGYSVTQNNYSNVGNYFSSPVAIEDISLSNLQALDASTPTVTIYKDSKKRTLLVAKDGRFSSRTPTFFINGDQIQQGYYVYFGIDKKADPMKKGKYIRTSEFAPPQIKKDGLYYFIFKVKNENGSISDAVVTEYRYKK